MSIAALSERYHVGWETRNPDLIASLHSKDTIFWLHDGSQAVQGRDALRRHCAGHDAGRACPSFEHGAHARPALFQISDRPNVPRVQTLVGAPARLGVDDARGACPDRGHGRWLCRYRSPDARVSSGVWADAQRGHRGPGAVKVVIHPTFHAFRRPAPVIPAADPCGGPGGNRTKSGRTEGPPPRTRGHRRRSRPTGPPSRPPRSQTPP